jgi:predicted DCC family thiol-disulfide oxidoreductase YuxK
MKRLYVLFDQECALCRRCCLWLGRQQALIELHFIPLQSPDLGHRFPGVEKLNLSERLVVVSDEGAVYQGQYAWIMCLYALRDYRVWSQHLAHPALLPLARHICELVSRNRLTMSGLFLKDPIEKLSDRLRAIPPEVCRTEGDCNS